MVWWSQNFLDDLFTDKSAIKWSRVKAGFKQILKDYPHAVGARVDYIELAAKAGDQEALNVLAGGKIQ